MRAQNLAGQRLGAQPCLAQRFDVLPLLVALFDHLALFGRRLVEKARKRAALVVTLLGELPLRAGVLVELVLQLIDIALVHSAAVGKLQSQSIPFLFGAL